MKGQSQRFTTSPAAVGVVTRRLSFNANSLPFPGAPGPKPATRILPGTLGNAIRNPVSPIGAHDPAQLSNVYVMTKGHVPKMVSHSCTVWPATATTIPPESNFSTMGSPSSTIDESCGHIPSHVFTIFSCGCCSTFSHLSLDSPFLLQVTTKNTKKSNHRNTSNSCSYR